ncbi:hypothetical protein Clacol_008845 [Clathrus columnatus]|uniref:hydroxymethylglutaryl-CoA lyase n=1 Tax=Clathrus columnatus TaxID=1419009 RepID=A0AAV5AIW9_9AGAM|nr:hypothetical protein Clacol_008845 [Clathrus columnatus]
MKRRLQMRTKTLQKHNWNVEQAATALLDNTPEAIDLRGSSANTSRLNVNSHTGSGVLNASNPPPARPNSVIDLTIDEEEEFATAQAASLNTQQTVYGPANMDTSNWALVPSNAPPILTQEERALNEALEASLSTSFVAGQDLYEEPPDFTERVRKTGFPLALRSNDSTLIHVPVVLQCLLAVPKIQERLRAYDPENTAHSERYSYVIQLYDDLILTSASELATELQRISAVLSLSARAYIPVNSVLDSSSMPFQVSNNHQPLAGSIREYFQFLATYLEKVPCNVSTLDCNGLLEFQGGTELEAEKDSDGYYIEINVPTPYGNDLMSCLAHCFAKTEVFLSRLAECFGFVICREGSSPLKYPSRMYMDRFLRENLDLANKLMQHQEGIHHQIQKLQVDRQKLANWQNQDTLKALRSTLYYFESLVNDNDDANRRAGDEHVKLKLRTIVNETQANIEYLDTRIKDLTTETENLFNNADLQNHPVSEDIVLNDQSGLHLGGGPLLLLYAKVSDVNPTLAQNYPREILDAINTDNEMFVSNPSEAPSQYETPTETPTGCLPDNITLTRRYATQPNFVRIVEVGPRDGLQNEKATIPVQTKTELIERLGKAGLRIIEAGSFVSPKWVPQMTGTSEVLLGVTQVPSVRYPVLIPNMRGLDILLKLLHNSPRVPPLTNEIAIFTAASESFCKANTNKSIEESLNTLAKVTESALSAGLLVRGYISVVDTCPFEGNVDPAKVKDIARYLRQMGCYEISLGDTVGTAVPLTVNRLLDEVTKSIDISQLAGHFHDTFGMGVANVITAVNAGVRVIDSSASVAGLGGCPYSPGATGNVATEDVNHALISAGYETGIDTELLANTGAWISQQLNRSNESRAGRAYLAKLEREGQKRINDEKGK